MDKEKVKLELCPWCKEEPVIMITQEEGEDLSWGKFYDVVCIGDCPMNPHTGNCDSREEAIKAWNTRK